MIVNRADIELMIYGAERRCYIHNAAGGHGKGIRAVGSGLFAARVRIRDGVRVRRRAARVIGTPAAGYQRYRHQSGQNQAQQSFFHPFFLLVYSGGFYI